MLTSSDAQRLSETKTSNIARVRSRHGQQQRAHGNRATLPLIRRGRLESRICLMRTSDNAGLTALGRTWWRATTNASSISRWSVPVAVHYSRSLLAAPTDWVLPSGQRKLQWRSHSENLYGSLIRLRFPCIACSPQRVLKTQV